ncbi:AsmA family protein [Rhizobiaceae bacterium BDR2-2]|uniref:AsmA family protein n=1 Tax=Ectorhizobium quercum TaxID=2965071 RepID=A0AAE3MXS4_9HYPH|nr:AsmA family protein [Ectorhizobium quercum]MCX8996431.1 AsmA family protein [Ectorhizobium quercum]
MLGKLLVALGGLVVAVLFAALLAPFFVDWTNFRTDFERQASRIFGKKVTVNGKVEARLLPFPSVTLHDVRVGQDVDGTPIVQIDRFSMDAELAPFLSGEARIFDMRIERPRARVRLLADGRMDWVRGATPSVPARTVILESVQIADGSIEFIDEQSGRVRRVEGLEAAMSAHSLAGPWRVEGEATVDGEKGRFTLNTAESSDRASLGLRLRLMPEAHPVEIDLDGSLAIEEARPVYKGNFSAALTGGEDEKPQPRVKGAFELTNERVRVPEYRLEIGAADAPYLVTGEATLDVGAKPEFLLKAEGQQIDVSDLEVNGSAAKTGRQPESSLERRLHALLSVAAAIPVPQVEGKATLRLPAVVAGDTTLRDIQLDVRPAGTGWIVERAVAVLPGRTQVEASGRLRLAGDPSFAGNLLVASSQPTGLANWLNGSVDPAVRNISKAGFSAAVSLSSTIQRFERLEVVLGESHLTGRLEHQTLAKLPPSLSADLKGELLDMGEAQAFLALFGSGDLFSGHELAAKLDLDRFTADGIEAGSLDAVVTRSKGVVDISRLSVDDLAGSSIVVSGRPQAGVLNAHVQSSDPAGLFRLLDQRLPDHPFLAMLRRNAAYYRDMDVTVESAAAPRDEGAVHVRLNGTANGSRLGAELQFELAEGLAILTDGSARLRLDATLENPDTSILFGQVGFSPLPLETDGSGLLAVTVKADGRNPAETALSFTTDQTRFQVDGGFALEGATFAEGEGRFKLESANVEPYLAMNGIAVPQIGNSLPTTLEGDIAIAAERFDFSGLAGSVGENPVAGRLSLARNAPLPHIEGELKLGHAAISWLGEAMYGPVIDPVSGDLPDDAFGKPLAGNADIALDLSVDEFDPGVADPITAASARLSYRSGTLEISDAQGQWFGGTLSGGRVVLANGGSDGIFRLGFDLAGADVSALAWKQDGRPMAAGKLDLALSAESLGGSLAALRSGLGGSGLLRFSDLAVDGLNLDVMGPLVTAADLMQGEITTAKIAPVLETLVKNGRTDLGSGEVPFQITEGEFRVQSVVMNAAHGRIAANGRLKVAGEVLNGTLELAFDPGDFAEAGAVPGARLHFDGPVRAPSMSMDVSDAANFLSLRAYERERRRVERMQANVMEKQRLRREVALYRFREEVRQTEAKARAEAEARARAEAEARARAEAEARKAAEESRPTQGHMPVPAEERVIQMPLPPPVDANP